MKKSSDELLSTSTIIENKRQLRREMKQKLLSLPKDKIAVQSNLACSRFISSSLFVDSEIILSYMAMDTELNPLAITMTALNKNKIVALPKIIPHTTQMNFFCITNTVPLERQLNSGLWGILEPIELQNNKFNLKSIPVDEKVIIKKTICMIVPGVAFSKSGKRLGHGKGFYDRYIKLLKSIAEEFKYSLVLIGTCLDEQMVESIPTESTDITMDYVLTQKGLIRCS